MTISAATTDGQWAALWDFFPAYVRLTIVKTGHEYCIQYEGTPAGKLDLNTGYHVKSNGQRVPAKESWDEALPAPEWIYFGDDKSPRVLFFAHHESDKIGDCYWPMWSYKPDMVVFGFGRTAIGQATKKQEAVLTAVNQHYTIGLYNETLFEHVSAANE